MQPFANNTFYASMHAFSGLMFGAFEYTWMLNLKLDLFTFLALSLCPLAFLLALKSKLSTGMRLYALQRPYRHIMADFAFASSIAGSASMFLSIYTNGVSVFIDLPITRFHTTVLVANLALFAVAVYQFSRLAKQERATIEGYHV